MLFLWLPGILTTNPWAAYLAKLAHKKVTTNWGILVVEAMPANMCVCGAIYMAVAAEDITGKVSSNSNPISRLSITIRVVLESDYSISNLYTINIQ